MIGDKHHAALLFLVPDFDATQKQLVVPSAGRFKKEDDLVAPNRTVFGNWTAFDDAVIGVVFHARNEEDAVGIEGGEPSGLGISNDGLRFAAAKPARSKLAA